MLRRERTTTPSPSRQLAIPVKLVKLVKSMTTRTWRETPLGCVHARHRPARSGRFLATLAAAVVLVTGCASTPRTATNFCRVLDARRAQIAVTPTTSGDITRLVADYEELVAVAPIEVESDLRVLLELFRLASNVNADDAEEVQRLADLSYGAEKAADDAASWVAATCGFDLSTGSLLSAGSVVTPESVLPGTVPGDTTSGG